MAEATVVVRAKNEEGGIERALRSLHAQTVRPEIIVVDSGSTDRTLEIARPLCDRLIEIPPEAFTYGYALNLGTRETSAPVVFALSAHCVAHREDWIERSLAQYQRGDVAGTNGMRWLPGLQPPDGTFFQDAGHARANPFWGFSNHASSWRRSVWERFPFDERLDYAEDKEWALRVCDAGYVIAFDPMLWVDISHGWRNGPTAVFRRRMRGARAIRSFAEIPRYRVRDLVHEWWHDMPDERHSPASHRFLNYLRLAGLAGKFVGLRRPPR